MKKRLKNKVFVTALVVFLYQVLKEFGIAPEVTLYQQLVDLICYGVMGFGIYSTFGEGENK